MRHERGFSLLETIAAMLLLAVAFTAVMRVSGSSTRATSQVRAVDRASMWADSKLESIGRSDPLVAGDSSGRFDEAFDWHMTVKPEPGERPELRLYRVDLDVGWSEGSSHPRLHFSTMRVQVQMATPSSVGISG